MYDFTDVPDDAMLRHAAENDSDDSQPLEEWQDLPESDFITDAMDALNTVCVVSEQLEECPIACNGAGIWMLGGVQITCVNCPAPDRDNYRLDKIKK